MLSCNFKIGFVFVENVAVDVNNFFVCLKVIFDDKDGVIGGFLWTFLFCYIVM